MLLHIESTTPNQGWLDVFNSIYHLDELNEWVHRKDEKVCLQLTDPFSSDKFHENFPMTEELLKEYNAYIIDWKWSWDNVLQEHALYHDRLYHYNEADQIEYIIQTLKANPRRMRALAIWPDISVDGSQWIYPCLIYIRCIVRNWVLDFDIHFRWNDAYKKILMDIHLWVWLMKKISDWLWIGPWTYTHFVNSCHFYIEDKKQIDTLYTKIHSKKTF